MKTKPLSLAALAVVGCISASAQTQFQTQTGSTVTPPPPAAAPAIVDPKIANEVGISARDGITLSGTDALITRNGVTKKIEQEITLGETRVRPDGTVTLKDGTRFTLKASQILTLDGQLLNAPVGVGGSGIPAAPATTQNAGGSNVTRQQGGQRPNAGPTRSTNDRTQNAVGGTVNQSTVPTTLPPDTRVDANGNLVDANGNLVNAPVTNPTINNPAPNPNDPSNSNNPNNPANPQSPLDAQNIKNPNAPSNVPVGQAQGTPDAGFGRPPQGTQGANANTNNTGSAATTGAPAGNNQGQTTGVGGSTTGGGAKGATGGGTGGGGGNGGGGAKGGAAGAGGR